MANHEIGQRIEMARRAAGLSQRALPENLISSSRAAELLVVPLKEFTQQSVFIRPIGVL